MGRRIILAVDGSEHAERAWDLYYNDVRHQDDDLILVHCAEPRYRKTQRAVMQPGGMEPGAYSVDMLHEVMQESADASKEIQAKFQKLLDAREVVFRMVSCFGKPGEKIVSVADEEKPAMIIMGTRGQSKVRRTIMGSVSNYVINHSHCPVLIARE